MNKLNIIDRTLHWISALLLLFMLMNLSSQLHNVDWDIKGQLLHRQEAVQLHATVGLILLAITLTRIGFGRLFEQRLTRTPARSQRHRWLVKSTHLALYLTIGTLVLTGLLMLGNYDIDLYLLGQALPGSKERYYQNFASLQSLHHSAQTCLWWLIALHFIGALYARK